MSETNFIVEPGSHSITVTHLYDAPRELVFKAYTDPGLIPEWWGPKMYTTVIDRMEVRPGGKWRFIQHDSSGNEHAFHGFYHQVLSPERLVYTFEWEGMPGHISLETISLENQAGKTLLTDLLVFQSVADRDGMYQSEMKDGATESIERLSELLLVKA